MYSGLSKVALKFPGEKSFPSPISVVSLTCTHFPNPTKINLGPLNPSIFSQRCIDQTFVEEKEFMCPGNVLEGKNVSGSRAINPHRGSDLVSSRDPGQLVPGPHPEDRPHREVCVHNARPIQRVKRYAKSTCSLSCNISLSCCSTQHEHDLVEYDKCFDELI